MEDRKFLYQMAGWLALGTALFFTLALLQTANAQVPAAQPEVRVDWNADPMQGLQTALAERREGQEPKSRERQTWGRERLESQARAERPARREETALEASPVEVQAAAWQGQAAPTVLAHDRNPGHGGHGHGGYGHGYGHGNGHNWGYRPIPQLPYGYYRPPTYQDPYHRWRSPYDGHNGPHNGGHYGWFVGPDGRMYWGPHQGPHWGDHGAGGHWPYPYTR